LNGSVGRKKIGKVKTGCLAEIGILPFDIVVEMIGIFLGFALE
jgi:hypothetical protein